MLHYYGMRELLTNITHIEIDVRCSMITDHVFSIKCDSSLCGDEIELRVRHDEGDYGMTGCIHLREIETYYRPGKSLNNRNTLPRPKEANVAYFIFVKNPGYIAYLLLAVNTVKTEP